MRALRLPALWLLALSTAPSKALVLRPSCRRATVVCSSGELRPGPGLGGRVPPPSGQRRTDTDGRWRDDADAEDAATEYSQALAEAQRADARLRGAERQLVQRVAKEPLVRPRGARATVTRSDAGTLLVDVPAAGLLSGGALFGAAFSVAWFSAIIPATASMVGTGGASALFMLPSGARSQTVRAPLFPPSAHLRPGHRQCFHYFHRRLA